MTVNVRIRVRHPYPAADAMARIRKRAEELRAQFSFFIQSVHVEWGQTLSLIRVTALSHAFTATIETSDRVAVLQIEVPEAMKAMSDRLEGAVRRELRRALDAPDDPAPTR